MKNITVYSVIRAVTDKRTDTRMDRQVDARMVNNSKRLGSMHGEQSVITGLSKEVKQKLFIRGCQHRSV